mgnify:CR=1 FL=1
MIKKLLLLLLLSTYLFSSEGNSQKGLTYYRFVVLPITDIKGTTFTKKHTVKEWKELFLNNAEGFKEKYSSINEEFGTFLNGKKFKKIAPDLEAFFIAYASDSSATPECGE